MLDGIPVAVGVVAVSEEVRRGGGVGVLGLEQMEESSSEGNNEPSLLLWSLSTRGKNQSLPSSGLCQPLRMLLPLWSWVMTLCLVKVTLRPVLHSGAMPMKVLGKLYMM